MTTAQTQIQRELDTGERLLWSGMPKQGLQLRATDWFVVPFSLFWGGFAILWETLVLVSGASPLMALFGVPFVFVGLYLIVGRFFVDARLRARTYYGVTDRRVLIVSGWFSRTIWSAGLADLGGLEFTEKADGGGTVSFGPAIIHPFGFSDSAWPGRQRRGRRAFDLIAGVRDVHARIVRARDAQ